MQSSTEQTLYDFKVGLHPLKKGESDLNQDTFSKIPITNTNGASATNIQSIFKDAQNRIWVGSNLSISLFLNNQDRIASFPYRENGKNCSITPNFVSYRCCPGCW